MKFHYRKLYKGYVFNIFTHRLNKMDTQTHLDSHAGKKPIVIKCAPEGQTRRLNK